MSDFAEHSEDYESFCRILERVAEEHAGEGSTLSTEEIVGFLNDRVATHVAAVEVSDPGRLPQRGVAEYIQLKSGDDSGVAGRTTKISNLVLHYKVNEILGSFSAAETVGAVGTTANAPFIPEPARLAIAATLLGVIAYQLRERSSVELTKNEARIVLLLWELDRTEERVTRSTISDQLTERFSIGVSQKLITEAVDHLIRIRCIMEDVEDGQRLLILENVRVVVGSPRVTPQPRNG